MYHTTGLTKDQVVDLCVAIRAEFPSLGRAKKRGRKRALSPFNAVWVTLMYLRRNRVQEELAELFGVSQPSISRAITTYTPIITQVQGHLVPTVDDLDPEVQFIVDGTLLPCWSWAEHPDLWSGKHRTTGVNVQVATTCSGDLAWVSDPLPGCTHDAKALRESGFLDANEPVEHIGDKGYIGLGMITPVRKPPGGELHDSGKEFNTQVSSIRATVERVIANLKTWRILHTDYRRPYASFADTISAVLALEFYRTAF